jgi:hypothetical protein
VADVGDRDDHAPALAPAAGIGSQYTASSKSRASSPSIVTNGNVAQIYAFAEVASANTLVGQRFGQPRALSDENSCGTANLRTAISISMPGSSIAPALR